MLRRIKCPAVIPETKDKAAVFVLQADGQMIFFFFLKTMCNDVRSHFFDTEGDVMPHFLLIPMG